MLVMPSLLYAGVKAQGVKSYLFQKHSGEGARCESHGGVARPVGALGGLQPPLVLVHHFVAHVLRGVSIGGSRGEHQEQKKQANTVRV